MTETLTSFNQIRLEVYRECYDHELAAATATVAAPEGIMLLGTAQREPIEAAMVPAITTVLLDGSGRVSHGTATFAMQEKGTTACMKISQAWVDAMGNAARSGRIVDMTANEQYRRNVYYGAHTHGACVLGGLALVRNKTGANGGLDYVEFVSTKLYEHISDTHDTRMGKMAVKTAMALRRLKGVDANGTRVDPVLAQAADFLKTATRDAKQRPTSPVVVGKPLFLTI